MKFKERLKELREDKNLTQTGLAEELNKFSNLDTRVYAQTVSYWENGREPSYSILTTLSKYFKVSTDYLLGITNIKNNEFLTFFKKDEWEILSKLDSKTKNEIIIQIEKFKDVLLNFYDESKIDYTIIDSLLNTINLLYKLYNQVEHFNLHRYTDFTEYLINNLKTKKSINNDDLFKIPINDPNEIYSTQNEIINKLILDINRFVSMTNNFALKRLMELIETMPDAPNQLVANNCDDTNN